MTADLGGHEREALAGDPLVVIRRLPELGRLMLTMRSAGVTHERMGPIENVAVKNGVVRCTGANHDASIDLVCIESVVVDRTMRMKDQALPRVDLIGAKGDVLISAIGLGGLEPFNAALAPLGQGKPVPPQTRPAFEQATLTGIELGAVPLQAACSNRSPIAIELRRPGASQRWGGVIEAVKPAMGFINVMLPDFHLHLRGDAVSRWRRAAAGDGVELHALDKDGEDIGLVLLGSQSAFA